MKLSDFSLDWFGQWSVQRRSLEEFSRAGLTNFLGSVQSGNDVSSIRHPVFPPVSGCEESTAYLTVNGAFLPSLGLETEHRWVPWAFLRRCRVDGFDIESRTSMPPGIPGVAMEIHFRNTTDASVTALAADVPGLLKETETLWRGLWEEVFTGGETFSGTLTDLDLPEDIAPLAAASVFSTLLLRRTHRPNRGKVRYSISMPRRVEACFYPNDWAMAARLLVELDPEPTWEQMECVSTYEHGVAGPNAAGVWMLDRLADLYNELDRGEDAAALREEADAVTAEILDRLYVTGKGWFRALQPDGSTRVVRHCWDVSLVLMCLADRLPFRVATEIAGACGKELMTGTWLRALSPYDADAAVSGTRADHQFNGAFGSWPAFLGLGLSRTGREDSVRQWYQGIAKVARQGPIGQAYTDEQVAPAICGAAAKVTDELPHCCHWCNISGGMYYEVLRDLFPPPSSDSR